jgi:phosphatidylglycerol lysyltransferase
MSSGTPQHWIAAVVLVLAALYLPLLFLTTRRPLMRWLPADLGMPTLRLKIELTLVSFVDWLLAVATLYACIYLSGEHVKPGLLLGAFAGAGVLGLVSQVPGGLGVFDGLILLALTEAGYDKASVFSGLMLFRITYYLLPLFGGLYMGSEMLTQRLPLLNHLRGRLAGHPLFGVLGLPFAMLGDLGMRVLAILTFGAGALQLASAAIPSIIEHVDVVRANVPILAVESSNWFSVLSGVLLLGLARGIDGRLRVAYRMV